ncbi:unnamed protein product [Symbiodinium natans]|uniref:Amino acid transporter transmembrane domain-containing protein n=1 Tax=Symbiodinium natans TaxID=878477 RepID=A0A812JYB6_9DINO|nr:unnamed protein product [Symbiodinium natans]
MGMKFSQSRMAIYTAGNMIGTGTHQTLKALAKDGCGNLLWANFLFSGMLVTLSAFPLLHLYGKFPANGCLHQAAVEGLGSQVGKYVSFINGQLITIELLFAVTMQASFFGSTLASFFPEDSTGTVAKTASLGLVSILWALYRKKGALFTANVAYWLGVFELCTVGLLVLSSPMAYLTGTSLRPISSLMDGSRTDMVKFPSGIHVAIFAYGGFPGMLQSGDLVENPRENLPLGIVGACIMTMSVYVLLSVSVLLVVEPQQIANFTNAFDSLENVLPKGVLVAISCTVLSSVANNVMENALVVVENLHQMVMVEDPRSMLELPNFGLCSSDIVTLEQSRCSPCSKTRLG